METRHISNKAADKQLNELTLLYQFSNTLLSTIRLNKLTNLILTALTSGSSPLFERAMLFLLSEKSGVLQGMLGVEHQTTDGLLVVGDDENPLGSHWDISDEIIAQQRATDFSRRVRATRSDIRDSCVVINRVILEKQLFYIEKTHCHEDRASCKFLKDLCTGAFAAAPLISRQNTLGMIVVDNQVSGSNISLDDLHFLKLFTGQAGMAIENSMLYSRLEEAHINLSDAKERLIHGERLAAIGEMTTTLAHELKNPLVTIGGFAGRLLKVLPDESREHYYADTIVKEVSRMERMLADILAFSSKPSICYCHCDLVKILKECFANYAMMMEDQGIRLVVPPLDDSWLVLGDVYQLKQVFLNLLMNACEAMPDGGAIKIYAQQQQTLDKKTVMISISDSGGGIPASQITKIFDPFFTTKDRGTGLGLAIVNRILLNHNGSIEACNDETGAVFRITLPLV